MTNILIELAQPSAAPTLTELARASKAHWGYDAAFLAACEAELTITPRDIMDNPTFIGRDEQQIVGFYLLVAHDVNVIDLDYLYVAPASIGRGWGRRLFDHAHHTATALGYQTLRIVADPNAAAFYERMGAALVGNEPSGSISGRTLPLFAYSLSH